VFAPHIGCGKPKAKKAVMLWFYGGALAFGSIKDVDGSSFAANQDIILVACNYRLGVFGFPGNASGLPSDELNPGFRDQKMAMRWIQENISRFGGDPTKVTIFGESAGAVSVDSHIISELTPNPPFRAAILQSGGLHTFNRVALGVGVSVTGLGTGNKAGEPPFLTLAKYMNCSEEDAVSCLQSKPLASVKSAVLDLNLLFAPVDDGAKTSVADTDSARRAGRTARVPVLIGSTFMEGNIFPAKALQQKTVEGWANAVYPNNSTAAAAVANAYSVGSSWQTQTPDDAIRLLHSDFQFACTTTYDSNIMASIGIRECFTVPTPTTHDARCRVIDVNVLISNLALPFQRLPPEWTRIPRQRDQLRLWESPTHTRTPSAECKNTRGMGRVCEEPIDGSGMDKVFTYYVVACGPGWRGRPCFYHHD
jgi:carboxylesterase type B